jgi:exodeoxyribonuclease-3
MSHTPVEVEKFEHARASGNWIDVMRGFVPDDRETLYVVELSRRGQLEGGGPGPQARPRLGEPRRWKARRRSMKVFKPSRGWQQPSDHVPVIVAFAL